MVQNKNPRCKARVFIGLHRVRCCNLCGIGFFFPVLTRHYNIIFLVHFQKQLINNYFGAYVHRAEIIYQYSNETQSFFTPILTKTNIEVK